MKKWRGAKRMALALTLAIAMLSQPIMSMMVQAAGGVDKTVRIKPQEASVFNDTNGDGMGEFQGFGTSLCWWANRIGYSDELAAKSGELFFNAVTGLGMNIGRYNLGGGDGIVSDEITLTANSKANFFTIDDATYEGSKMSKSTLDFSNVQFTKTDADFGFKEGTKGQKFTVINYVNSIGGAVGSGDNLHFTVDAPEAGEYTIKLLVTLTGTNERGMTARVYNTEDSDAASASAIEVSEEEYVDYSVSASDINANMIASNGNSKLYVGTISGVKLAKGENKVDVAGKASDWGLDFIKMAVIKKGDEAVVENSSDEFLHSEHIVRSDAGVPGYWSNVTKIDLNAHDEEYYKANFAQYDLSCGYAWNYDWEKDHNQLNVLKAAINNAGADSFIAEVFSNSPPYFMTVSGCSSGNTDANKDNLRGDSYTAFAKYMADVIDHLVNVEGIKIQSTTPTNEPYTNYWQAFSPKQEGCHFDQGQSQSTIIVELNKQLQARGLSDVIISGTDETSIDTQITSYNRLSADAKNIVTRIDTHTYSGTNRTGLKELAISEGKNLWMSEVDGDFSSKGAGEMSAAIGLAKRMVEDINGLEASAWILWNAIDMHADSSEYGQKWVNAGSANDYLSMDALKKAWMKKVEDGYWGLAAADHDNKDIILTQKYYAFGQLSRYVRPGMTVIGSSDEGDTLVAYDTVNNKLVIVSINDKSSDKVVKFDLSLFNSVGSDATVQAYRTSGTMEAGEQWADVSNAANISLNAEDKFFTATAKGYSITSYVVSDVVFDAENAVEEERLVEIPLDASMVTGSAPWNNGSDTCDKAVDNNYTTFFDGIENGYLVIELPDEEKIAAVGVAGRNGYAGRTKGATIAGSKDGRTWVDLYTIEASSNTGSCTLYYDYDFNTEDTSYKYIKYYQGPSECANIAEIKLYKRPETLKSIDAVYKTAKSADDLTLPATVKATTTEGRSTTVAVEWEIDAEELNTAGFLDIVKVTGFVDGSDIEAVANVLIAPSNLEYVIDCNNPESEVRKVAAKAVTGLLNETGDKPKADGDSWGYTMTVGDWDHVSAVAGYNGDGRTNDLYGYGWCADKGTASYDVTLPAGIHEVTVGQFGYWGARTIDVYYTVNGTENKGCEVVCTGNNEGTGSFLVELEEESVVSITTKKHQGFGDPNVSFISVSGPSKVATEVIEGAVFTDGTHSLPSKVSFSDGDTTEELAVNWKVPANVASLELLSMIKVTGSAVSDADLTVEAKAIVLPVNLEYMIDCGNENSNAYNLVKKSASSLVNKSGDQATDGNWGYKYQMGGPYGNKGASVAPINSGWYDSKGSNGTIEYELTLPAGNHTIMLGADCTWWGQWGPRRMDVSYTVDGKEYSLGTLGGSEQKSYYVSGVMSLENNSKVTVSVKKASEENQNPILSLICVSSQAKYMTSFTGVAGEQMYDIDGNRIQAHGGQIQLIGDTYYWIGEDKTDGYQPCYGVHMYSSKDLYNWKDEGLALKTMTSMDQFTNDSYFSELYADYTDEQKADVFKDLAQGPDNNGSYNTVIERPKFLYNEKTDKYVMWFHCDGKYPNSSSDSNYAKARAGIAIADSPAGPYKYVGSYLLATGTANGEANHGWDAEGGHVRDMNLFKDDDGTAYVLYSSEGNAIMYIAKLNDSYTGLVKDAADMVYGEDFVISSTDSREAPAMFKYNGKYYLITSQCTGWAPNTAGYSVADDIFGTWKRIGDPCVDTGNAYPSVNNVSVSTSTTWYTQPTCVIPYDANSGKFIYMGDRWYNPEKKYDISDSRYVWLPIEFASNGEIMIKDYSNWTLEDLNNKGAITFNDEDIPDVISTVDGLEKELPSKLDVSAGGVEYKDSKVTWTVDPEDVLLSDNKVGYTKVTGHLEDLGRDIQLSILTVPANLVYFADCNTNTDENTSEMFELVKANAKHLKNTVSDQAKAADGEDTWGYTSTPGASGGSSSQDMGSKGEGDFYETGWWATDAGSIKYSYTLTPGKYDIATGYNEWWSATRGIKITATSVDEDGIETELKSMTFKLQNQTNHEEVLEDVEVPKDSDHVVIKVSCASNQAPILSWMAVRAADSSIFDWIEDIVEGSEKDKARIDKCYEALTVNNIDDVRGNLVLPTVGVNSKVSIDWESSNTDIITDKEVKGIAAGIVNRPAVDTEVKLTATLYIKGVNYKREKEFIAKVKATPTLEETTDYLFAYFTGDGGVNSEQIYFSNSRDGLKWSELNNGDPVITSNLGEKGLRDPFIMRSHEGDKFYLIATDLRIASGRGWSAAQTAGSQSIMVWESTDLVNWSEQRMCKVAVETAGCTWAPEAFWDDEAQDYIVFWASKVKEDNYNTQRIYKCHTRDFYTYSEPEVWIEIENKNGQAISVIDTTMVKVGDTYYRFSKNEAGSDATMSDQEPENSKSGKYIFMEKSKSIDGRWERIFSDTLSSADNQFVEGATCFKFNADDAAQDTWCLLLDDNGGVGYYPLTTTDMNSGEFTKLAAGSYSFPGTLRHGSVLNITANEYAALQFKWPSGKANDSEAEKSPEEAVIAQFTFDNLSEGIFASTKGDAVATVKGSIENGTATNGIRFNGSSWLDVKKADGSSLLAGDSEITISYYAKTETNKASTGWTYFAAPNTNSLNWSNTGTDYEYYLGCMDWTSKLDVERYNGTRRNEDAIEAVVSGLKVDGLRHVVVSYSKTSTAVYVDGKLMAYKKNAKAADLTAILGENPIFQIGKSNWGSGEYFTGTIARYTIFDKALSTDEVNEYFGYEAEENDPSYYVVIDKSSVPSVIDGKLNPTLQLKVTVNGKAPAANVLTFTSSDEKVATVDENGKISFLGNGEVIIKAAAPDKASDSVKITVNGFTTEVTPKPEDPKDPVVDPENPGEDPKDPVVEPEDPKDPVVDPENPGEDPKDPVVDPEKPEEEEPSVPAKPTKPAKPSLPTINPGNGDDVDPGFTNPISVIWNGIVDFFNGLFGRNNSRNTNTAVATTQTATQVNEETQESAVEVEETEIDETEVPLTAEDNTKEIEDEQTPEAVEESGLGMGLYVIIGIGVAALLCACMVVLKKRKED